MSTVSDGNIAEQAVAEYLAAKAYKIKDLNWKTTFAEIDIVAEKNKTIYFVEVKYRRTLTAGDGFDYITPKKLMHMQRAAEAWVSSNRWQYGYELMAAAVLGTEKFDIDIREI
ncbi:MAG: YraN family protein [bacterium]|nr:YraN family protein [bacterium]